MTKLSIIIPVYNVEQYIGKCLDSCMSQDLPKDKYEIVVVDDGSPDNSGRIVEEYMKTYSNIRLIHRENGGLSAARNTGLREAKGEYVWFVDSDDWIERNCLGLLVRTAEETDLDVLCFGLQLDYPDGRKKVYDISHEESGKAYKGIYFISAVDMPPAAVCAIYRKRYLQENGLYFMESILHEDMEYTPKAYCAAARIAYVDIPVYHYFQREGSIMKSNRDAKRCKDLLTICDSLYDFTLKHVSYPQAFDRMMEKIAFCFSQSLHFYSKDVFPISTYKEKPYYPVKISFGMPIKLKLKYALINLNIPLYMELLRYSK